MVVIGAIFTCLRSVENCAFRLFFGSANQGASARSSDHLLPLNDSAPNSPKVPHFCPLYSDPIASAASSQIGILYFSAMAHISSNLAGMPYRCTGMMALGYFPVLAFRSWMACSKNCGDIFQVSSSESTKTGVPPR